LGQEGEMAQALYAHMNNKKIKRKKEKTYNCNPSCSEAKIRRTAVQAHPREKRNKVQSQKIHWVGMVVVPVVPASKT
jgi:hypothetical protein